LLSFLDLGQNSALAFPEPYAVQSLAIGGVLLKIAEVRQLLNNLTDDQLKTIISELYKIIPKRIKEEQAVDDLLKNPPGPGTKREKPKEQPPDFEMLSDDVRQFIEDAYAQYYFAPNSVVAKKDRPKWRFLVKRFCRDLTNASTIEQQLPQAAELLEKLYVLLCHSCAYVLFSAYDPFQSVGIPQVEFFRQVLALNFQVQAKSDFIHRALMLILDQPLNRYSLYEDLMLQFLDFLKIPDLKETAVVECERLIQESKGEPPKGNQRTKSYADSSHENYQREQRFQNLALMGFLCYVSLGDYDKAIDFFKRNHSQDSKEVALYILLRELSHLRLGDYWRREYEAAVQRGVSPREKLRLTYEFLCTHGRFPETLH
jgi:hypothetical protein